MTPRFSLAHEPPPRDFSARQRRGRLRTLRQVKAPRRHGRSAMLAVAAIALPAFAAPNEWRPTGWGGEIGRAGRAEASVAPMPFERAGDSFPGAALYYLSDDAAASAALLGQGIHSDADPAPTEVDPVAGPAARMLRVDNSGIDRSRALHCLTAAIYYEAASEPDAGQRAVAQVVLNRVAHPSYPSTVCGVVFQGSERSTGCQFSFTCDGALARVPNRMFWLRAEAVARAALAGFVYAPIGLATHYHTVAVHPYWADSLRYVGTLGAHRFYRFGGAAGAPATFRFAYLGGEPLPQPNPQRAGPAAPAPVADPVVIQRAYETAVKLAQANPFMPGAAAGSGSGRAAAPPPVYSAELQRRGGDAVYRASGLPGSDGVLPEYQQSGRWIAQPN